MTWLTLSWKEWRRRPGRTAVTVAGVAVAVAALFSLLCFERGYQEGVRREVDRLGAHVLVVPKGCPFDAASMALHGASWPCYLKEHYLEEVRTAPGVGAAAPALMAAFYDKSRGQSVYVGIDTNMLALKRTWHIAGKFPREGELLVGGEMAKQFNWQLGDSVKLAGSSSATARVRGILSPTHSADDYFIFMPLADAQRLMHRPGELTHILVRLEDANNLDNVVRQLRGCDAGLFMNIVPLTHLFRTIQNVVGSTRWLLGCIALVALLVAGAGVSNTLLMAVSERTREIGVLRALGASRLQIVRLFWLQTVLVCVVGAILGILVAFVASHGIEAWLRSQLPFTPGEILIRWHGSNAAACLVGSLILGSVAGCLPAFRAGLLSPIEAVRTRGGRM